MNEFNPQTTKRTANWLKKMLFLFSLVFLSLFSTKTYAYCSWSGYGTGYFQSNPGVIPCGSFSSVQYVGSGTYSYFYCYAGLSYRISTIGGSIGDTQLTIYDANPAWTYRAYDDDNGPDGSSLQASVDIVAGFTGDFLAVVNAYNCQQWQGYGAASAVLKIMEIPAGAPGTPTGGGTYCSSTYVYFNGSPGTGYTWYWQTSPSGTSTSNSGSSQYVTSSGTWYVRPRSTSGCWGTASAGVGVTIVSPSVGGSISGGSSPICIGSGTGTMSLSGQTGSVIQWEKSLNGGSYSAIATTSTSYSETPSSVGTWTYRALVQNSPCGATYSSTKSIQVDQTSAVGTATSVLSGTTSNTQCGTTFGATQLSSYTGSISYWQYSFSSATGPWTNWGQAGSNPSTGTCCSGSTIWISAVVQNGSCPAVQSNSVQYTTVSNPSISILTADQTICSGGSVNLTCTVGGGTGTNTIQWQYSTNNATWNNFGSGGVGQSTGTLSSTTYYRAVYSSTGYNCGSATSNTVTITVVPQPSISITTASQTICSGGSLTLSASTSGGTGTNTLQWQYSTDNATWINFGSGGGTQSTGALTTTTYYRATYASSGYNCGTATSNTVTISVVSQPSISITTASQTICSGGSVTLSASASGGTGTNTYQWQYYNGSSWVNTGSNSSSFSTGALTSTTQYRVQYSSTGYSCGTATSGTVTITVNPVPSISISTASATICTGDSRTLSATASGGTGTATYQWQYYNGSSWVNDGTNSLTYNTGALSATRQFRVQFSSTGNNCTTATSNTVTMTIATPMTVTPSSTSSTCGNSNGQACVTVSNGTAPYTYAWAGGGSSSCKSSVSAGSYAITVTDNTGCTTTSNVNVTDLGSPTASITAQSNLACYGNTNGSATVTVSGGTPNFNLTWSNGNTRTGVGAGAYPTTTGLAAGVIAVTVTDANGCNATASTNITQPTQLNASIGTVTNVLCYGGTNGAITLNVSGGTGSDTYTWSGPGGPYSTQNLTNKAAGSYSVTVTDANSCSTTTGTTITQPAAALAATPTITNVSCNGLSDGSISESVSGGTTPYTYVWTSGSTSSSATGLAANSYTVTVTDAHSCTLTQTNSVTQPTALSVALGATTNINCYGNSTGSITVSGSGGTAPYTYNINGGSYGGSGTFSGLSATSYTLGVKDAHNCTAFRTVTLTQPAAALSSTVSITAASCYGTSTGAVDLTVSGGTTPYGYSWSGTGGPYTTEDLSGVAAGTYNVTVTDNVGCTTTKSASVTQPAVLTATATPTAVTTCYGNNNGQIVFSSPSGGHGTYEYSINGTTYQPSTTFSNLTAGTYPAYVRDAGTPTCAVSLPSVTVGQPAAYGAPVLPAGTSYQSCGLLVVNVTPQGTGATKAILYNAVPVPGNGIDTNTSFVFNTLPAGNYTYYVTSYNPTTHCESPTYTTFTLNVVNPVLISGAATNVTCYGAANGAVNITPSGGTAPYTYSWSNGSTAHNLSGLSGGFYNAVVTDINGCFNIATYNVRENAPLNIALTPLVFNGFNTKCHGTATGSVSVNATGGTGTYTYHWNDGNTTAPRLFMAAGTYSVTVTDGNGCIKTGSVTLYDQPQFSMNLVTSYQCGGGGYSTATITALTQGGISPFSFSLNGQNPTTNNVFANQYPGNHDVIMVTDSGGCVLEDSTDIVLPGANVPFGDCDYVYVAPASQGGDDNNIGTPDCPTTLSKAMTYVTSTRNAIKMLGGADQYYYSAPVNIVDSVYVEGGYTKDINGDWVKSSSTPTVINFDNAYVNPSPGLGYFAGIISSGKKGWSLVDMTMKVQMSGATGSQDGNGKSVYGVLVNSSSRNYTMSRVNIYTGDASPGADGTAGANGLVGADGSVGTDGAFYADNTAGAGPYPSTGSEIGGNSGAGGGSGGGSSDLGSSPSPSSCAPKGSSDALGGGAGGAGGAGGVTNGSTAYAGSGSTSGGNGGKSGSGCTYNALGAARVTPGSSALTWLFYSQAQPSPVASGGSGLNGNNGGNAALSYTAGVRPNIASLGEYYSPGHGSTGGNGYGGSGGSGGAGTGSALVDGRFGTPKFLNICRGAGGGGGGGGGQGGSGGIGGGGGGSNFGIYISSTSTTGATLQQVNIVSQGTAGNGGTGGNGGVGGTGGFGGQGGASVTDTVVHALMCSPGGNGGNGGTGGSGGRGQDGDNGVANSIYFGGGSAPVQGAAPSNGTVQVNTIKGCTNSEIQVIKSSTDPWNLYTGTTSARFVNNLTRTSTSYTTSSDTASIYYTTTGNKDLGIGTTNYTSYINIRSVRALPVNASAPYAPICQGQTINLSTYNTALQWEWQVALVTDPTHPVFTGNTYNIPNVQLNQSGTYQVRFRIKDQCCGWSIPVYDTVVVSPLPDTIPSITGPTTVCANTPGVVYKVSLSAHATNYLWSVPPGTSITSAGGTAGVTSGGFNSITVTIGSSSGTVSIVPSNGCGTGATTSVNVTVNPSPNITSIVGPAGVCTGGSSATENVLVNGGTPAYGYLWSNGATTQSISVLPTSTTTYTVTVTDQGSCSATASKTISVNSAPSAAGGITGLNDVPYQATGVVYTTPTVPNAVTYVWTVPAGATIVSGQNTNTITVNFGTTSGNIQVTPTNPGCTGSPSSMFVTVEAAPVVWNGSVSTDWNTAANWVSNTVPVITDNVLIPTGMPRYPNNYTSAPLARILTIESGASVTLQAGFNLQIDKDMIINSGGQLNIASAAGVSPSIEVKRNWSNNGTFVPNTGTVLMDGPAAQTISGNNTFFDLEINNSNGVTLNNTTYVADALNLHTGVLHTNDLLVIKSDINRTGLVDDFSAGYTGSLDGQMTMQRFIDHSVYAGGFHYVASPVNNPSISQLNELQLYGPDGGQIIPMNCSPTAVSSSSPYGNMFEWRENAAFIAACQQSGWFVRSAGSLTNGRGYAAIVNGSTSLLDIKGTANTGNISYSNLTNSNAVGDGWNQVGNPYPSPIEWNAPTGFDAQAQVWVTTGSYHGTYQPILSGTGADIPSMQGFFVRVTNSGSANFTLFNSDRRNANPTFHRTAAWYNHILNINVNGNGFADKTTIYFAQNPTAGWDSQYDANKKDSKSIQPTLYTKIDNFAKLIGINGLPDNNTAPTTVPMGLKPGTSGSFTFTVTQNDLSTFDPTALIFLEDLKTGTIQNMRADTSYTFTMDTTESPDRFLIHFVPGARISTVQQDCAGNPGSIAVDLGQYNVNNTTVTWDSYSIKNAQGTVVSSGNQVNGAINVPNTPADNYTLNLQIGSYQVSVPVAVTALDSVKAQYSLGASNVFVNTGIQFVNQSLGATTYNWNFGDGNTSTASDPIHSYTLPGLYQVMLTASNTDCIDSFASQVKVEDIASGISNTPGKQNVGIYGYQDKVNVTFDNVPDAQVTLDIYDVMGRKLIDTKTVETKAKQFQMQMDNIVSGYYFVRVTTAAKIYTQKVYLSSDK